MIYGKTPLSVTHESQRDQIVTALEHHPLSEDGRHLIAIFALARGQLLKHRIRPGYLDPHAVLDGYRDYRLRDISMESDLYLYGTCVALYHGIGHIAGIIDKAEILYLGKPAAVCVV